jgi:hypothetical protein
MQKKMFDRLPPRRRGLLYFYTIENIIAYHGNYEVYQLS